MADYSKPMVTIELEEYNNLIETKDLYFKSDIQSYVQAFNFALTSASMQVRGDMNFAKFLTEKLKSVGLAIRNNSENDKIEIYKI